MPLPSPSSDAPSIPGPVKTLYPLACVLVGPEDAPTLLLRVYREAASAPPAERPDTPEEWLLALLRASHGEETPSGAASGGLPEADSSSIDSLRQEVAERRVEDVLPTALAACSPQERFLIAVEALGEGDAPHAPRLARALNSTPSLGRAALWAKLRSLLSEPEVAIVDEAVSDAFLLDAVRDFVAARYASLPSSLRSRLRKTVDTARTEAPATDEENRKSPESPSDTRLPSRPRPRTVLFTLLLGMLVLAGGIGVWYATQPSSAPSSSSTSLIAYSSERADSVSPDLITSSRPTAEAYVESAWNRQIEVPNIKGTRLQGVGRIRATNGVEIPVLLYANATSDSTRITTFAYSYALVDRIEATATLDTGVREALARRHHLVTDEDEGAKGLLWRDRDDIFVVVAPSLSADSLRARLRP